MESQSSQPRALNSLDTTTLPCIPTTTATDGPLHTVQIDSRSSVPAQAGPGHSRVDPPPQDENVENEKDRPPILLTDLPTEILEKIAENLTLSDGLGHLRLACGELHDRAGTGPHMKSHFRHQTTDLSFQSLARLEGISSSETFGPGVVKRLTVLASVYYKAVAFVEMNRATFQDDLAFLSDRRAEQALSEVDGHEEVIGRLAGIFKNLSSGSGTGGLESLDIDGVVVPGVGRVLSPGRSVPGLWNNVSRRAGQAFYITVMAMVRSGIQTPVFEVFPRAKRCSVPLASVSWLLSKVSSAAEMEQQQLGDVLGAVRNFSLSFSPIRGTREGMGLGPRRTSSSSSQTGTAGGIPGHDAIDPTGGVVEDPDELDHHTDNHPDHHPEAAAALDHQNFQAIPALLRLMPSLETLDLHMYNPFKRHMVMQYKSVFVEISRQIRLPNLGKLVLRGIWATEDSLLSFLENHSAGLEHLELRDIWLVEGDSWAALFRLLNASKMPCLKYLRLENLFYGRNKLVNLAPKNYHTGDVIEDRSTAEVSSIISFPCTRGYCIFLREFGQEALRRAAENGKGLEFTDQDRGRLLPSPEFEHWKMRRADEFGPPPEAREWEEYQQRLGLVT